MFPPAKFVRTLQLILARALLRASQVVDSRWWPKPASGGSSMSDQDLGFRVSWPTF